MGRKENIQTVVRAIGDDRLTRKQVVVNVNQSRAKPFATQTVYNWLGFAMGDGLVQRTRAKKTNVMEYVYFAAGQEPIEDDEPVEESKSFVIGPQCAGCGQERRIEIAGNANHVAKLHATMAWSCASCGDHVRLMDCMTAIELHQAYLGRLEPSGELRMPAIATLGK